MMTKFIDYIFFRIYMNTKEKEDDSIVMAVLAMTIILGMSLGIIWMGIPFLLTGWTPSDKMHYAFIFFTVYFILYLYYSRRSKNIINKYKRSTYNKQIPFFVITLFLFLIIMVATIIGAYVLSLLKDNHYEGIVGKWILGLFQ